MSQVILLVEDNPTDEKLALLAFQHCQLPHRVVVAHDGSEALDYLFGDHNNRLPALVLLDLKLPRVDGHAVLRRIRQEPRTRFLPVVILTGSNEPGDVNASYRLGANAYVCKPVGFEDLSGAVRTLVHFWLHLSKSVP